MNRSQAFSLGSSIEPDSIYVDFAVTKSELARLLDVTRPTVWKWDKIAYFALESYREAYPIQTDKAKRQLCERDKEVPLSPYQVWVLSRIKSLMNSLRIATRVKAYIRGNPHHFSVSNFQYKSNQVFHKGA
ncbi:hypothetical protein [Nostoc sp.]|jgi:hypothetical protein